jgi:hypothetical protein
MLSYHKGTIWLTVSAFRIESAVVAWEDIERVMFRGMIEDILNEIEMGSVTT